MLEPPAPYLNSTNPCLLAPRTPVFPLHSQVKCAADLSAVINITVKDENTITSDEVIGFATIGPLGAVLGHGDVLDAWWVRLLPLPAPACTCLHLPAPACACLRLPAPACACLRLRAPACPLPPLAAPCCPLLPLLLAVVSPSPGTGLLLWRVAADHATCVLHDAPWTASEGREACS
jgi:hypothetical protein